MQGPDGKYRPVYYTVSFILYLIFAFDSDIWIIIQKIRQKWRNLSLEEQEQYNYDSPNDHDSKPSSEDEANSGIHSDTSSYHAANGTYWPLLMGDLKDCLKIN